MLWVSVPGMTSTEVRHYLSKENMEHLSDLRSPYYDVFVWLTWSWALSSGRDTLRSHSWPAVLTLVIQCCLYQYSHLHQRHLLPDIPAVQEGVETATQYFLKMFTSVSQLNYPDSPPTLVLKACLLESVSTLFTMVPWRGDGPDTLLEQTSTTLTPTSFRVETTSWWNIPVRSMPLTCNNRGHTRPLQTTDLQQLVSIPEAACVAHRAMRQYGANVVVRSDLHSVLHVHCPLQTDAQAASHSPLGHTANLQTAESDKLAKPLSSE